ncbi:hypothetical protein AVEN_254282-1 [Araneus ventricosus]|uniref:Uncharacterized protein n=1 Tax=Araneus ventricosus TaxID=182803 RepID=A0A4Y2M3R6_ARAVE|nr:hypothetical protein AVEN_254282-1 [Araneus ventricosus]
MEEFMENDPEQVLSPVPVAMEEVSMADWQAAVTDLNVDVHKMIRDAIRHLGKLRNLVFMATEYEEVTLTLEDGYTLSSEETILRTLKEIINKWVSDITCFGICSLDNFNAKEIENKLISEEAERKRNIPSSSSTNNVCINSSVTSHDNVNVMSNNNNARKRAAPNESECSNNSRIRLDNDGFIYPSRRNSVPKRNLNADENSNILLQNKYADIERLPAEKEVPSHRQKFNH